MKSIPFLDKNIPLYVFFYIFISNKEKKSYILAQELYPSTKHTEKTFTFFENCTIPTFDIAIHVEKDSL